MRFHHDDSRRFPNDGHWGVGIWYYGWDESAVDANLGYHSFSLSWRRSRPPVSRPSDRIWRMMTDPVYGLGIYNDSEGWFLSVGPWMRKLGKKHSHDRNPLL